MAASLVAFEPTRHADYYLRVFDDLPEGHRLAIRDALHDSGNEARKWIKRKLTTGRRTGRIYRIFGRNHQASAPGEFPAKLTGKLSRNVRYDVRGAAELEVGIRKFGNVPYPMFLEFGTRKMARRPYIEEASNEFANRLAMELVYYTRVSIVKRLDQRRLLP